MAERSVRLLQLKLALRILKRYCPPSPGQSHGDLCDTPEAADVYVAASQLVNLLVAMQGRLPTGTLQGGFNLACNVLLDQCRARYAPHR